MNSYDPKNRVSASGGFGSGFDDDFDDDFDNQSFDGAPRRGTPAARNSFEESSQRYAQDSAPHFEADDLFSAGTAPLTVSADRAVKEEKASGASMLPAVIIALICILSAVFIPSGDAFVSDADISDTLSASLDMKIGFDNLLSNVLNAAHGLPPVYSLPMTDSPASKPIEENYSSYIDDEGVVHSTYQDETISVDCWRKRYYVNDVSTMAAISRVKITHPTQLRSAFAGGQYGSTRLYPSVMSKQINAVVAINGELYNYAGKTEVLVRQGTVYRDDIHVSQDLLFIDSGGDFHVMTAREAVELDILNNKDYNIYQSLCFGPALVIDGEVVPWSGKIENANYRNPRSALGQLGPLEYLLVAVEGRAEDSKGLTTGDLAILMKDLGCLQAYNVDGGQSSMLIFHNKPFNSISNGSERTFSDIIYFGSALPQE